MVVSKIFSRSGLLLLFVGLLSGLWLALLLLRNPHSLTLKDIFYNIETNRVEFRYKYPEKNDGSAVLWVFDKKNYPQFFRKAEGIRIIPLQKGDKLFYVIGNVYQIGRSYAYNRFVIADIFGSRKIVYKSDRLFNRGIYANIWVLPNEDLQLLFGYHKRADYGQRPTYFMYEIIGYNKKSQQFVSRNSKYPDQIKNLMVFYNKVAGCAVTAGGKKIPFARILNEQGENFRCRSSDKFKQIINPITPREYYLIRNLYSEILEGNEKSLFSLTEELK